MPPTSRSRPTCRKATLLRLENGGSALVTFGFNTLSSFDGQVYSFDFTPTETGMYTFAAADNSKVFYASGSDPLTLSAGATVNVQAAAVPEPAGVTLAAVGCGALALGAWRRRRAG